MALATTYTHLYNTITWKQPTRYVMEGEIWWSSEYDHATKQQPHLILILKILDNETVLAVPLIKARRKGAYFYTLAINGVRQSIVLHQMKHLSTESLTRRVRKIDRETLFNIKEAVRALI